MEQTENRIAENGTKKSILCAIHPQGGEEECLISLRELERLLDSPQIRQLLEQLLEQQ